AVRRRLSPPPRSGPPTARRQARDREQHDLTPLNAHPTSQCMGRATVVGVPGSSGPPDDGSIVPGEDLAFAGVARLSELLRAREITPRELVELYLVRIERLDPALNAFVSVRGDAARAEADVAHARLRAGESAPLLGVPVVVKDNVHIAGEVTGHGTAANETRAGSGAEGV